MSDIYMPGSSTSKHRGTGPGKRAIHGLRKRKGRNKKTPIGQLDAMVFDAADLTECTEMEVALMKSSVAVLEKHYPAPKGIAFWWSVETNHSVLNVFNLALSGREGFILHIAKLDNAKLIWAGGEILERYGVSRDPRKYSTELIVQKHLDNPTRFLQAEQ